MSAGNDQRGKSGSLLSEDVPCFKERQQSLACLDRNNYDYSKCEVAFENFKFCRQFWEQVRKHRKRLNIKPDMPGAEDRKEIFAFYKKTGKLPDFSQQAR
ncbi:coiled-coil-helix-coiled-coil-helix domain-containing protein 7 [Thrips palmi]|uniref:Coiled-coil-helix-coiled-coil-helix domain-containing protein 7 n=1 Tax=Thrips palmi TaxID=161013 RepID=A0A6P8Z5V8_THRPL|nr:coiled-coil-helix-coiled-coil-helix domain-containing protein 7 [Thrips palmi]